MNKPQKNIGTKLKRNNKKFIEIYDLLLKNYNDDLICMLDFNDPFELLVSSRLSAQCTDVRVNMITEKLFQKYKTPKDFAEADIDDLEKMIFSCGLYHSKARDIKKMSQQIVEIGKIPDNMEDLLKLAGVGRKIANLVMGEVYGGNDCVVADTHCIRLSNRLGFCAVKDPYKVEKALIEKLPSERRFDFCHALVKHGREVCKSQNPDCTNCIVYKYCIYKEKKEIKN